MEVKDKRIKFLLLIITILIFVQIILTVQIYVKVYSLHDIHKNTVIPNSIITSTSTIESTPTLTPTLTPYKTESIISDCASVLTTLPEIRSNLDAFYYANQDVRVCGTILSYHIYDNKDAIIQIDLDQKEKIEFPFDVRITIPSEINKSIYSYFDNNKDIESCFEGTLKYRDRESVLGYEYETLTLIVNHKDDICIP